MKQIVITVKPNLDIRQGPQVQCQMDGFSDPLEAIALLQDVQTSMLAQARQGLAAVKLAGELVGVGVARQ